MPIEQSEPIISTGKRKKKEKYIDKIMQTTKSNPA
jgi:hypothetical protein